MSRLSKANIHNALDKAAAQLVTAGGDDTIVSRRDIATHLPTIADAEERALTQALYAHVDGLDTTPRARVTHTDIDNAIADLKAQIDASDVNNNGLSAAEQATLPPVAQLAANFAAYLRANPAPIGGGLTTPQLKREFTRETKDLLFLSESESKLRFASYPFPATSPVTEAAVLTTFSQDIVPVMAGATPANLHTSFTADVYVTVRTDAFLNKLCTNHDPNDPIDMGYGVQFTALTALLRDNLTDLHAVKVGVRLPMTDPNMNKSVFLYMIVGKSTDGNLVGVTMRAVET